MNFINNYPVCNGCSYSSLHYCKAYDEECYSVNFNGKRCQLPCLSCLEKDLYTNEKITLNTEKNLKKGYFHLPGPENLRFFRSFIEMRKRYPEAFRENCEISEIYGAFPGAIWNGRTPNYGGESLTIQEIDGVRQDIENLGISLNLTWNNHLVSGTDVYDRFCNSITEVFHNGKHSITVASPELFKYLKEKYPNFKYYQSVIQTELDQEFAKKDPEYDFYLMNRKLNNNWDKLLQIPENERGNIEFLCNDACTPICRRVGHYNVVNSCLLRRSDESCLGNYCTIDHDFMLFNVKHWPMTINPEDLDKYINNGFCHFKLCSRGDMPPILMYKMAKYLAKPEYIEDVFSWAISCQYINEDEFKSVKKVKENGNNYKQ